MRYSPKLKKAMKEIERVLEKYDVAASVVLHTPGHTEYLTKIDPSYSCAKLENRQFLIKTKGLDISKEKKKKMVIDTANMLNGLATTTGLESLKLMKMSEIIDERVGTTHKDLGHTSQEELDN